MRYVLATILLILVLLTGCWLKENYTMQYSFTSELATETEFETKPDGIKLAIPFADFSCDQKSFKAVLNRTGDTFNLTISGTETDQRCSQKFSADISGIAPGSYQLRVFYLKGDQSQQAMFKDFTISE